MSVLGHLHEFCVYVERATNHFKNGSALPDIFFCKECPALGVTLIKIIPGLFMEYLNSGRYFNKNNPELQD